MKRPDRTVDPGGPTLGAPIFGESAQVTLAGDQTLAGEQDDLETGPSLAHGDRVGRYLVLDRLGAGGMGVVHLAYDPDLDRRIALKLLHSRGSGSYGSVSDERARLLREAQAMARLSHPNVVSIFDVGEHEGRVFIAMELVDGQTLKAWRKQAPRTWQDVLAVFLDAGRGLAAAHEVGLVHRDFKPDNVMVGRDGRARVTDFGLARSHKATVEDATVSSVRVAPVSDLTVDGAIVGTPAYMSTEQWNGARPDARADQFAFCVSLYEVLYEQHPFTADSVAALAYEVSQGHCKPPPKGTLVPAWVHAVVLRGMRPDAQQRFASMDELLAALQADPRRRARRWIGTGAVALALAASVGGWQLLRMGQRASCERAGRAIEETWNDTQRAAGRTAFVGLARPWTAAAWDRTARELDRHAASWQQQRSEVCLAERLEGTLPEASYDAVVRCLDEHHDKLAIMIEAALSADAAVAASIETSLATLPDAAVCREPRELARWSDTQASRPESAELRRELHRARMLDQLGKKEESLEVAEALAADAAAVQLHDLQAEALVLCAALGDDVNDLQGAEANAWEAFLIATRIGRDDIALSALEGLVYLVGYRGGRPEEGLRLAEIGRALLVRSGTEGSVEEAVLRARMAAVYDYLGQPDSALAELRRALEIQQERFGPDHPKVVDLLSQLANIYNEKGMFDDAIAMRERALTVLRNVRGVDHPSVAVLVANLGGTLVQASRPERAEQVLREALELDEATGGHDPHLTAQIEMNLGAALSNLNRAREALPHLEHAVTLWTGLFGNEHIRIAELLTNMGIAHAALGEHARALELHRKAIEVAEATVGPQHRTTLAMRINFAGMTSELGNKEEAAAQLERALADAAQIESGERLVAVMLTNLSGIEVELGRFEQGREHAQKAVDMKLALYGESHPSLGFSWAELGHAQEGLHDPAGALTSYERALRALGSSEPRLRGWVGLSLAKVRMQLGQPLTQAREDAIAGLAAAREVATEGDRTQVTEIEAWLAEHGGVP